MSAATILALIAAQRGLDFRDYRRETLERAIAARAQASTGGALEAYAQLLARDDGPEMDRLLEILIVPVTGFFRDPPVFAALESVVLPRIVAAQRARALLRAWAVGVSTGEEAWTLAMCLNEASERGVGPPFEIIATDLSEAALAIAARGAYAADVAEAIPAAYAQKYGQRAEDRWTVRPALSERVHFAQHQLMGRDLAPRTAVVASFQLVSLRNVLIYLDRRLQAKLIERLAAVIEPGGALVLGMVENLPASAERDFDIFPGVSPELRIYQRRGLA